MAQYDVDLRDYWRILKKRKWIVILMTIFMGVSSYAFGKFNEPVPIYEAIASVKIERKSSMADFLTGAMWFQSESVGAQTFMMTSFPVLEQTAKRLGWIPANLSSQEIRDNPKYSEPIQRIRSLITAEQESATSIINIRVRSENPTEAAAVANAVVETYKEYHTREKNKQTFDTKAFIEEQLRMTSTYLNQAENELKQFKEANELISAGTQTEHALNKLFALEAEYEATKRQKEEIASQLKSIGIADASLKDLKGLFLPELQNSPIREWNSKLRELVMKRQTLLVDFTEKHPQVVEIDDQIRGILYGINKELSSLLKNLETRETDLKDQLSRLKKETQSLPEKTLKLEKLQREVKLHESLYSQLKTKYQEIQIQASGIVEEVSIIRPASVPAFPINIPSRQTIVGTGIVMGLFVGLVFAFFMEVMDTSIGTIEDVENLLHVPVLGVIPFLGREDDKKHKDSDKSRMKDLIIHYEPKSLAAEAFRAVRTNLQFMNIEHKRKSFLITSTFIQEGKTLNVANIALSLAQAGNKVLLIEGDLRNPSAHKIFGLDKEPGLTDYVLGNYQWKEVVNTISDVMLGDFEIEDILKTPGLDNLHVIPSGMTPPNPSEIMRSGRFREFLKEAYSEYDIIIIDAPPILPVTDAVEIAPLVDGVILVYTVGKIARGVVRRAKASLDQVQAQVVGVILNNLKSETGPDYFKYQSRYYYGSDKPEESRWEKFKQIFSK